MNRLPRARDVAAVALWGLLGLAVSGCGGDAAAVSDSKQSDPRPPAELPADPGELLPPGTELPDVSIPESIPDADVLQQCVDLTAAYSEVVVLAFSGDDQGKLPVLFDTLDAAAPDDVRDDLAVVRESVTEASEGGLIDATGELLSEEFNTANAVVVEWLAAFCGGEGG